MVKRIPSSLAAARLLGGWAGAVLCQAVGITPPTRLIMAFWMGFATRKLAQRYSIDIDVRSVRKVRI